MDLFDRLSLALPRLRLLREEPLAAHTSFRIGGPAEVMAFPSSLAELQALLHLSAQEGIRVRLLGAGTNILAPDGGVRGLVIVTSGALTGLSMPDAAHIEAMSGVTMARLACFARDNGLTGLEFAHGIPGTVGGGVFMNAGAYDGEMAQVIDWVDCLDETGAAHRLGKDELKLGYRTSVFSQLPWSIVGAHLTLTTGDETAIREKMADLAQRRRSKQPLEYPSAGSTFKRPVGHFAGGLIEQCGLKGTKVGGAQVSEKHAGFVINAGGATCRDILALIRLVRATVLEQTGVTLEPEVRLLGCALDEES